MASTQGQTVIGWYKGDTFRKLIRQYSNSRMERDREYRNAVHEAVGKRRVETAANKRERAAQVAA